MTEFYSRKSTARLNYDAASKKETEPVSNGRVFPRPRLVFAVRRYINKQLERLSPAQIND